MQNDGLQDSEAVAEHLVARGEASQALSLLRRPDTPRELIYNFAPPLMASAAEATVDFWLACHPPLEPRCAVHLVCCQHLPCRFRLVLACLPRFAHR